MPTRPLARAAARNDLGAVRTLIAGRHRVDERDDNGLTPLMWAARAGAVAAMTALLDAGAAVDARDARHEWTALQHAIHKQRVDAVRALLDHGADPNAQVHPGALTPLLMAAGDRDPAVVKLLLAHGAIPGIRGMGRHAARPRRPGGPLGHRSAALGGWRRDRSRRSRTIPRCLRTISPRPAVVWLRSFTHRGEHARGE